LAAVIVDLESSSELLGRLEVMASNLVVRRGVLLEVPRGQGLVTVRCTRPAQLAVESAASAISFADLSGRLGSAFPSAEASTVHRLLAQLIRHGFLITSLRAPVTVTDPLSHLCERLDAVAAGDVAAISDVVRELHEIQSEIEIHNDPTAELNLSARRREALVARMRGLSEAGRVPLAVTLRLDSDVRIPEVVAYEMERAATALMRLTRQPTGDAVWRDYYTAFCERYGMEALVPLTEVIDPAAGIGLPATYPGSLFTERQSGGSRRDEKLLALAWQALAEQADEVVLTDQIIASVEIDDLTIDRSVVPPHVELAAGIETADCAALDRGDFTLTVRPARAAGTLTSRFADLVRQAGLDAIYRRVPVSTGGAVPVQLSFPPMYAHAENVCRVPRYLPDLISIAEFRTPDEAAAGEVIGLDDLAVMATHDGLHLVRISRHQILEPQAFHALALDKQPPPVARFLAHLSRARSASWHAFDWGPHARQLGYLPRVRYGRSVLSPARWRLTSADLSPATDLDAWRRELDLWRARWRCPSRVELVSFDQSLPLDLTETAHAALAQAHLASHDELTFVETADPCDLGWTDGHAHHVVLPMVATASPAPSPLPKAPPLLTNNGHGQLPGAPGGRWLFAKLFTHPDRMNEILADHLPGLLGSLDQRPATWFARYRSPHETDHLRLRLRARTDEEYQATVTAVGAWAQNLRTTGLASRLMIDTYHPEAGRYGQDAVLHAAEGVFVADSQVVLSQLRRLGPDAVHPVALAAVNMFDTAAGFLGTRQAAATWWKHRAQPKATVDRAAARQAVRLVRQNLDGFAGVDTAAWEGRAAALAKYRHALNDADRTEDGADTVLESLLHMHHNRALGIDRPNEAACQRIARQVALAWLSRTGGHRR
jgi:thiopeptide-type bacteriocin biosynthesis protein